MNLVHLVYWSRASSEINDQDIASILDVARERNQAASLTGYLAFSGGVFLQVLEGRRDRVNELFQKISRDERHDQVEVLGFSEIARREFSDWAMGYAGYSQSNKELMLRYSCEAVFDPSNWCGDTAAAFLRDLARAEELQPV